jgi:hypothetical protein
VRIARSLGAAVRNTGLIHITALDKEKEVDENAIYPGHPRATLILDNVYALSAEALQKVYRDLFWDLDCRDRDELTGTSAWVLSRAHDAVAQELKRRGSSGAEALGRVPYWTA